jgi:predicted HTH domain antitoxin
MLSAHNIRDFMKLLADRKENTKYLKEALEKFA